MIALFTHPVTMTLTGTLFMLLPLVLSVAVVYKTIRARKLSALPRSILVLFFAYILPGLVGLAVALWAIQAIAL